LTTPRISSSGRPVAMVGPGSVLAAGSATLAASRRTHLPGSRCAWHALPAAICSAASKSCGPRSGLHSTVQFSFPATMASKAAFTPSMETITRSLPGLRPAGLDGLDGPHGHVVVVGEQSVDLGALRRAQEGLHDLLALGAGELSGLGLDDLHPGLALEHLLEALLPVDGRGGAGGALQLGDASLAVHFLGQPCGGAAASSTKSEPMKVVYRLSSVVLMARSERITGMCAPRASLSTGSQPVSTTGRT